VGEKWGENDDPLDNLWPDAKRKKKEEEKAQHSSSSSLLKRHKVHHSVDIKRREVINISDTEDTHSQAEKENPAKRSRKNKNVGDDEKPATEKKSRGRKAKNQEVKKAEKNNTPTKTKKACEAAQGSDAKEPYRIIDQEIQKDLQAHRKNLSRTQRKNIAGLKFHFSEKKKYDRQGTYSLIDEDDIEKGIEVGGETYCEGDYVVVYLDQKKMAETLKTAAKTMVGRIIRFVEQEGKSDKYGFSIAPLVNLEDYWIFEKLVEKCTGLSKLEDNELVYLPSLEMFAPINCIAGKAIITNNLGALYEYKGAAGDAGDHIYVCCRVFDDITFDLVPIGDLDEATDGDGSEVELTSLERTAMMLNEESTGIVGRVEEKKKIEDFLLKALDTSSSSSNCLYVKGRPGIGKTAAVIEVLKKMAVEYFNINCAVQCQTPKDIFSILHLNLCVDAENLLSSQTAQKKLDAYLSEATTPQIVVLDEVDYLLAAQKGKNIVLYNLFSWAFKYPKAIILVAIANTMDLQNKLEARVASRAVSITNLNFSPYTPKEIEEIIKDRLALAEDPDRFDWKALKTITGQAGGDIREAIKMCTAILNNIIWNEETTEDSGYRQVVSEDCVLKDQTNVLYNQKVLLDCIQNLDKGALTTLIALIKDMSSRNQDATTLYLLFERFAGIAFQRKESGLPDLGYSRFDLDKFVTSSVASLVECGILSEPNQELTRGPEAFKVNGKNRKGKCVQSPGATTVLTLKQNNRNEIADFLVNNMKNPLAMMLLT